MIKKTVHVVTHTHWDREWYGTFQEFRVRLVDLMDHTLRLFKEDPQFKYFTLDGQTVVLEDYLDIRPEQREKIKRLVKEGKLFIGPWYVLVDEFLVSGESLVRNLLIGHRIADDFGGPMKVGYLPDMFGHISQMPQILNGFDIDTSVIWRGFRGKPVRSEYNWEAPDGSSVLTYHMPEPGYAMVINLPDDLDRTEKIFREWYLRLSNRSDSARLLIMNGVDHLEPQPILTKLIRGLNTRFKNTEFVHSHLQAFFEELRKQKLKFPTIHGELKAGYDHACILVDILSARMYLKILNDDSQRALEKYSEPLNAFSVVLGGDDYNPVLTQGWKYVIRNHPHDTIGGCSIDEVHQDMIHRFRWSKQISEDICSRSLRTIAVSLPDDYESENDYRLVVFNPTQYPYTGCIEAEVLIPDQYPLKDSSITDSAGNETPAVIHSTTDGGRSYPRFMNNPSYKVGKLHTIELFVEDLPPLGYRRYRLSEAGSPIAAPKIRTRNIEPALENEHLKVKVNANGTMTVKMKSTGRSFSRLHYFESGGDAGDEYNYGKPIRDRVVTTLRSKVTLIQKETSKFYEKLLLGCTMDVPAELTPDRKGRSRESVELQLFSEIKLEKNSKRIDITTILHNNAKDHRFRVIFPSGKNISTYHSDSKFDVVRRNIKVPPKKKSYSEVPTGIKPHDSFVDVSDGDGGLAIITRGTPEHEVVDVKDRPIAITLVRSVGWLSRGDNPYRRGNSGPEFKVPEAQGHGIYAFHYSIYPHEGSWEKAQVYREALKRNATPLTFVTNKWSHGIWAEFPHSLNDLPEQMSFFTVEPDCFVVTATKVAEDGSGMIIRVCNLGTRGRKGLITLATRPGEVWRVNLAEREIEQLESLEEIRFHLRTREIFTIKVQMP